MSQNWTPPPPGGGAGPAGGSPAQLSHPSHSGDALLLSAGRSCGHHFRYTGQQQVCCGRYSGRDGGFQESQDVDDDRRWCRNSRLGLSDYRQPAGAGGWRHALKAAARAALSGNRAAHRLAVKLQSPRPGVDLPCGCRAANLRLASTAGFSAVFAGFSRALHEKEQDVLSFSCGARGAFQPENFYHPSNFSGANSNGYLLSQM